MSTKKKDAAKPEQGAGDPATYEQLLAAVERKLEALESGELSLEQSLVAYEEGVRALRSCHALLKVAEGKIQVLAEKAGDPVLADFGNGTGEGKAAESSSPAQARKRPESKDEGQTLF